jgi:hypothetical protein
MASSTKAERCQPFLQQAAFSVSTRFATYGELLDDRGGALERLRLEGEHRLVALRMKSVKRIAKLRRSRWRTYRAARLVRSESNVL